MARLGTHNPLDILSNYYVLTFGVWCMGLLAPRNQKIPSISLIRSSGLL